MTTGARRVCAPAMHAERHPSRRLRSLALVLKTTRFAIPAGVLLAGTTLASLPLTGCDKEKTGVEKRAEDMAAEASAAKSATVDAAPDPAEIKYKERKTSLEKTVANMKADEAHIMDKTATPGILRQYYDSGPEGDKTAKELEAKRTKDGVDGYRIKKAAVKETRLAGNMEDAEIEVQEETLAKGNAGCLLYVMQWKWVTDKWVYKVQKTVKKVDCD